jgi:hypothetical protein
MHHCSRACRESYGPIRTAACSELPILGSCCRKVRYPRLGRRSPPCQQLCDRPSSGDRPRPCFKRPQPVSWRAVFFALTLGTPTAAQCVFDGDTIRIGASTFRLGHRRAGSQTNVRGGLVSRTSRKPRLAIVHGRPRHRMRPARPLRPIALCRADGRELGASMVREGMVMACTPKLGHAISM